MHCLDPIVRFWPHLAAGFDLLACLFASVHVLLNKRDTRAATLWIACIWFLPLLGPVLYLALGVNRIRRRAILLGVHGTFHRPVPDDLGETEQAGAKHLPTSCQRRPARRPAALTARQQNRAAHQRRRRVSAMLAAIESAKNVRLTWHVYL